MQIHELKPKTKAKKRKRVARGGKRGNYSGRGHKGQKSRAGAKIRPAERDLIIHLPKKRGFGNKKISERAQVINLKDLEKNYSAGEVVSIESLLKKGLIKLEIGKKKPKRVKILGEGKLTKSLKLVDLELAKKVKGLVENK